MSFTDESTPFQRFVLLALAELDGRDETPAFDYEVRTYCEHRLDDVTDPFGRVTRCGVIRALTELEGLGLVRERDPPGEGLTGLGRPTYALAVPREEVWALVEEDAQLGGLVEVPPA